MRQTKPEFFKAPQELRRKAVNFRKGFSVNLTDEITAKLEKTIAANGDAFAIEVMDKLKTMRQAIQAASQDNAERAYSLPRLATTAREIKGMGGIFGYPLLTLLAKLLNDFIGTLSVPTDAQFEVVRIHVDAMYVLLAQHVTGAGGPTEKTLVNMLHQAISKVTDPQALRGAA